MAKDGPSWYYKKKNLVHRNTFWTRKLGLKRKKKKNGMLTNCFGETIPKGIVCFQFFRFRPLIAGNILPRRLFVFKKRHFFTSVNFTSTGKDLKSCPQHSPDLLFIYKISHNTFISY